MGAVKWSTILRDEGDVIHRVKCGDITISMLWGNTAYRVKLYVVKICRVVRIMTLTIITISLLRK